MSKENLQREVFIEIKRLNSLLAKKMRCANEGLSRDLNPISGLILKFLFLNQDMDIYQRDIEEEFRINKSRLSKILSNLEKVDLIKRVPSKEDARFKKIVLGEKSKKINKNILKSKEEMEKAMLNGIAEEELEIFYTVMDKIENNIKKTL